MEKISRILPTNSRINNSPSDWNEGNSLRAGRNIVHSSKDLALQAHRELRGWRAKEARHNDIADKIQSGFFSTERSEPVMEAPQMYTEDFLRGSELMVKEDSLAASELDPLSAHDMDIENYIADVMAEAEAFKNSGLVAEPEEDWSNYPKGSFINIEA